MKTPRGQPVWSFLIPAVCLLISVFASCHSWQLCCCVYRHRFSLPSESKHQGVFCCLSDSYHCCSAQDSLTVCGLTGFPICKPPALVTPRHPGWSVLATHQCFPFPVDVPQCQCACSLVLSPAMLKQENIMVQLSSAGLSVVLY